MQNLKGFVVLVVDTKEESKWEDKVGIVRPKSLKFIRGRAQ